VKISSLIPTWDINKKRIILRADLNVPLTGGTIHNDFRLQNIRPTLDYLRNHQGIVIILTHLGRPKGYEPALSTRHLIPWFEKHKYLVVFARNFDEARTQDATIILFENLRFFPGEQTGDIIFAQELQTLGDFYVNDAFAAMHRTDTSITVLPSLFNPSHRSIGFLVEKELAILNQLMHNPKKPLCVIIGGGKVHDKIPLIEHLMDKATTILLCPGICFTFLKTMGKPVGKSLVDEQSLRLCEQIIKSAQEKNIELVFPLDYQVAKDTKEGQLSIVAADHIPSDSIGISIGPRTIDFFSKKMDLSQTIFFNGAIGFFERSETLTGMCTLLKKMSMSTGTTIIAGGDSSAAAFYCNVANNISYISTGGGATLAYISGQQLPGLVALNIINK
jgi:3-phosphoglycerate kinase